MTLKDAIIQAPILHYPDPAKKYIVYMDAQMMCVEYNQHWNMIEWNSQLHSYLIPLLKQKESGVPQNRKHMEYTML